MDMYLAPICPGECDTNKEKSEPQPQSANAQGCMDGDRKKRGKRIRVMLLWLVAIATLPARAQTASAQLNISLTVQSSISLVFNDNPSVGTPGFCPLTNAGTSNVGLDLGSASFTGGATFTCVNFIRRAGPATYEVNSAFDVLVTKSNSSSPSYSLQAEISTVPPPNVIWQLDTVTLTTAFAPLDAADSYGLPVTKTLRVQVKNNVPAQVLQETITFLATAN
jgi:hypothetical protein